MAELILTNMSQPHMNIERDILTLTQWLSPAFPLGSFAYSHGLETAIQTGQIETAPDLENWLRDVLEFGSGRNDCIILRAAYHCGDNDSLKLVDQTARAFAASKERLMEADLQGSALGQTISAIWGGEDMALTLPVALGNAAAGMGIDAELTTKMYLHAFASNLVSATVRAVPLGQTEGQRVLAALTPLCESVAAKSAHDTLEDLQSTAFLSDIAAMQHETLQPRIFRS